MRTSVTPTKRPKHELENLMAHRKRKRENPMGSMHSKRKIKGFSKLYKQTRPEKNDHFWYFSLMIIFEYEVTKRLKQYVP